MNIHIVILDTGLDGIEILSVWSSEKKAQDWIDEQKEVNNYDYGTLKIEEFELDEKK